MEENKNIKKGKKYLVIGIVVLFLSILGASVSYYLARVQGTLTGRAAGMELELTITKLSTSATDDLIPLDNDLETLGLAALGYGNNTEEFDASKACIDINGYSVCQIYRVRVSNNGNVPVVVNGTVSLAGANTPNIDCAKMDDEVTVTNNASCMGQNILANSVTLAANSYNDYYIMVYINNLDEPQYDSGEFNGTVVFITQDGKKIKGRFSRQYNAAQYITSLYTDANKTVVETGNCTSGNGVNNTGSKSKSMLLEQNHPVATCLQYNYATSVNLMNDRLGGTTQSLDGGNIRYYGGNPNNYIDIGDKYDVTVSYNNWEENWDYHIGNLPSTSQECNSIVTEDLNNHNEQWGDWWSYQTGYSTQAEYCSTITIPAGTPILWRIIGVFDGKLRIVRGNSIGVYSYDSSDDSINGGNGVNEWSQADLMKLLNPGYGNNQDSICIYDEANDEFDCETSLVNNSLWWNSESGSCYNMYNNQVTSCDFTSTGLSEVPKEYIIDQTIYLGGVSTGGNNDPSSNRAYTMERGTNVWNGTPCLGTCDTITRTTRWIGKVGLIYPSDFGYAADLSDSNCQSDLFNINTCTSIWIINDQRTITPPINNTGTFIISNHKLDGTGVATAIHNYPVLTLSPDVLIESGAGTQANPYVITD